MGGRRTLILVGLVVVAVALAIGAYLWRQRQGGVVPEEVTPEAAPMVSVVVATNNLDRGTVMREGLVEVALWPEDRLPPYYQDGLYYSDVEDTYGLKLRSFVPQGMPLMRSMLTAGPLGPAGVGSEEALDIPVGKRALAIPIDLLGGVAWIIEPGDHVDVLASWQFLDVDEEFRSLLPNEFVCVGGETPCQGIMGRMEILPTGQVVMVYPGTPSVGSYVAQLTIQDAVVLRIEPLEAEAPPPAEEEEAAAEEEAEQAPPAPAIPAAQTVVLIMDVQDAVVLKALLELQADIDLALRGVDDGDIAATAPATMDYILSRYGMEPPPRLPYVGVSPETNLLQEALIREAVEEVREVQE